MGAKSRRKGVVGEREWGRWLREHLGLAKACRGAQRSGSPDSPDVMHGIPGTHAEVKRKERFNAYEAMDQATEDCGDAIPYVATRRNRREWLVVVRASDLEGFAEAIVRRHEGVADAG